MTCRVEHRWRPEWAPEGALRAMGFQIAQQPAAANPHPGLAFFPPYSVCSTTSLLCVICFFKFCWEGGFAVGWADVDRRAPLCDVTDCSAGRT